MCAHAAAAAASVLDLAYGTVQLYSSGYSRVPPGSPRRCVGWVLLVDLADRTVLYRYSYCLTTRGRTYSTDVATWEFIVLERVLDWYEYSCTVRIPAAVRGLGTRPSRPYRTVPALVLPI